MATRRPAKIAKKQAREADKVCPITDKPMTAVRLVHPDGRKNMVWMVVEDFDGSDEQVARLIPTH